MTACLASHHAALPCTCEQMELRAEVTKLRAALAEAVALLEEAHDYRDDSTIFAAQVAALKTKVSP